MLRNIENLNSVALILSDLNIGVVVAAGSAIAHDLRLRERLQDMPMEEFPGQPMLGKRPTDPQPDTKSKRSYPGGGHTRIADTLRSASAASASPTCRAESAPHSLRMQPHFSRASHQRHQHWRRSRALVAVARSQDGVAPVCCPAVVSG